MSDDQFWKLTPAELFGLLKRVEIQRESEDFRSAQICCILANANRDSKKRKTPYKVKDFMPASGGDKKEPITNRGKQSRQFFEQIIMPSNNARFKSEVK